MSDVNIELNPDINVYWQGTITSITTGHDDTNGLRWAIMSVQNKCIVKDALEEGKRRLRNQKLTVYTKGGLSDYVFNELEEGDKIYIVGALITKTTKWYGRHAPENCIEARQIFKCDYLKYYTRGKD